MFIAGPFLLLLAAAAAPETDVITGTAAYRERIMVPPDGVFEATLEDVSRADASSTVIARQRVAPAGAPPYAVRIPYDPAVIEKGHRYSVRATLEAGGMRWTTDTAAPVLTHGVGATVQLVLKRVAAPAAPAGTFDGLLPCADCPGIQHRLTLSPDQTYHLRTVYRDRPDGVRDEIGSWIASPGTMTLVLEGSPEGARYFAIATADRLTQLDTKGDPIASTANLDLARVAAPAPVEPRLVLQGLFRYLADTALFEECRTRRRLSVAMEGGYQALESAYAAKRETPGAAVLAIVEGRIVDRVNMEGPARPTLVVERFDELRPGEVCAPRFAAVPLEGTYWRLTELEGAPVPPGETRRSREAHLVFGADPRRVAGGDGCNGIVGPYELDGTRVRFDRLAGTSMACPDVGNRDQLYRQALARTASLRLLGPELQLRDAEARLLARFAAAPRPGAAPGE